MCSKGGAISHPEFVLWYSRLNLSPLHFQVVQTLEDHHQEVLSLYRDYGFAGLIAQDSEFALCNVPAYFSSHALKLSWNGKNLTTHQYLLSEAARQLGLKTQHLPCFAALLGKEQCNETYISSHNYHTYIPHFSWSLSHWNSLTLCGSCIFGISLCLSSLFVDTANIWKRLFLAGNHILPDEDLAAFHWSLLGPEHPLASLKVPYASTCSPLLTSKNICFNKNVTVSLVKWCCEPWC